MCKKHAERFFSYRKDTPVTNWVVEMIKTKKGAAQTNKLRRVSSRNATLINTIMH